MNNYWLMDFSTVFVLYVLACQPIFIIPFSIIFISSIKLIIFLRKNSFNKRKDKNESEKSFILKANPVHQKAIKIVLSIVFMFIIQWLPLWTGNLFF